MHPCAARDRGRRAPDRKAVFVHDLVRGEVAQRELVRARDAFAQDDFRAADAHGFPGAEVAQGDRDVVAGADAQGGNDGLRHGIRHVR